MVKNVKLLLAGLFFLAAVYHIQAAGKPLECWHCNSATERSEDFCGVTFDEDAIPTDGGKERNYRFVRPCNSTMSSDHERAVCRKTVEEIEGKVVTKRFCYYTNKSDALQYCLLEATNKDVHRIFCEDCLTDKCNAATKMAAIVGTMLLPLLLSKVFAI